MRTISKLLLGALLCLPLAARAQTAQTVAGSAALHKASDFDPAGAAASAQAYAVQRANHTGTQPVGTITGLGAAATLGIGTTASTVAAGNDSRFAGMQGVPAAAGDGSTDDSAAIQAVLTTVGAAGGGTVVLDCTKRYAINPGVITIPFGVTLMFDTGATQEIGNSSVGGAGSVTGGGQFVLLGGVGATDTAPAYITLAYARSALVGAQFYDPAELTTLTTPVVKPFAVRITGYGATVSGLDLIDVYRGIDNQAGRSDISHITGNPLSLGIRSDSSFDASRITDCHFVDSYVRGTSLATWFAANSTGFVFLDNDQLFVSRVFTFDYMVGVQLAASAVSGRDSSAHGTYGSLTDSGFDGCQTGVLDSCTNAIAPMILANVQICANGASYGSTTNGYWSTSAKSYGITTLDHCTFWGASNVEVRLSGGTTQVRQCEFTTTVYGIYVDGAANIFLSANTFQNGGSGATISIPVTTATGYITADNVITTAPGTSLINTNNSPGIFVSTILGLNAASPSIYAGEDVPAGGNGMGMFLDGGGNVNLNSIHQGVTLLKLILNASGGQVQIGSGGLNIAGDNGLTLSSNSGSNRQWKWTTVGNGLDLTETSIAGSVIHVLDGGMVGLGTASPVYKLDVSGPSRSTAAILTATVFASRISAPVVGTEQMFSDSTTQTWGATISGGGSLPALGLYDGTNWTVVGK